MSNSRGEERRRRSDMPGSQAVRVVFRSRPWSGTARAATPRAGSGSRARPEPDRVGGCVWPAVTFPQPGLAEGPPPLQRGRVKGAPRPLLSTPGSPNPRLAHGPVRCLCVSVRVHQIPRLRVCACARVCSAVCGGGVTTGDAYLFHRLGGFSGGVSLDEPLLPASSLTRNTRNTGLRASSQGFATFATP